MQISDCRFDISPLNLDLQFSNLKSAILKSCNFMSSISEFVYHRRVQFPETDASGIVHFTNFFKYVEEAEHAMWRAVGLSIQPSATAQIGWPRVAASFEFRRAAQIRGRVRGAPPDRREDAKTHPLRAVLKKEGEVLAEGSLTIICVRQRPGEPLKAIDMPADIAARFEVAQA